MVIGGSAVGIETATFLARFGVNVTLVHRGKGLMEREEPRVGELGRLYLQEAGVKVRPGTRAVRARREGKQQLSGPRRRHIGEYRRRYFRHGPPATE